MKRFSFGQKEKLKSKKLISQVFNEGNGITEFPLKLIFLKTDFNDGSTMKAGVSVGKKNFKKAVERNYIKRLIREAYRLNKYDKFNNITDSYAFMILYLGKDGMDFEPLNQKMKKLLKKFSLKISET